MPDITRLDTLTAESFASAVNEPFRLTTADGATLELTLVDARGNGQRGARRGEQFSVHYLGPRDPVLPQMIYRLENPRMGILEIFLVPIGRDDRGVTYEAVFT